MTHVTFDTRTIDPAGKLPRKAALDCLRALRTTAARGRHSTQPRSGVLDAHLLRDIGSHRADIGFIALGRPWQQ